MNSYDDKIKWFCEKLFENIKMIFLCLSVLVIGVGLIGIEELSKRTNLPKEILAFVLIGLFTQVILSITDALDQEHKTESKDKVEYFDTEGNRVHYDPDKYNLVSISGTRIGDTTETSYIVREKLTNPIQEAIEKDKENLDQILDEDTSEDILTLANTISRINTQPNEDDLNNIDPDAPVVATSTEDSTGETSDSEQNHQEVKQTRTEPTIGDALDTIRNHSDSMVVKQEGQQITIKATLNKNNQNKTDQWGEF